MAPTQTPTSKVDDNDSSVENKGGKSKIAMRPLDEVHETMAQGEKPSFEVSYGGGPNSDKFRKNPLVPLGAIGTGCVLMAGLFAFKSGNPRLSQHLMRARVVAQGATLAVLGVSVAGFSGETGKVAAAQSETVKAD